MGERWTLMNTAGPHAKVRHITVIGPDLPADEVEVVPASALKRCEEERDEKRDDWAREHLARESAEAKCERLEAEMRLLLEEAKGMDLQIDQEWGVGAYEPDEAIVRAERFLSTPKTEGSPSDG